MNFQKILESMPFEKVMPRKKEIVCLNRVKSTMGTIEFTLLKKGTYPPHVHSKADARLYILSGKGTISLKGRARKYKSGNVFSIPKKTRHGFHVKEKTILLSIQSKAIRDKRARKIDITY